VPATPTLTNRELCARIWTRLRPYRRRLFLSLGLLVFSVPFVNFHPLVWGYVADGLVQKTLTPTVLGIWLAVMFFSYLIGIACMPVENPSSSFLRHPVQSEADMII